MRTSTFIFSVILAAFFLSFTPLTSVAQSVEEEEFMYTIYDDEDIEDIESIKVKAGNQPVLLATPNPSYGDILKIWYGKLIGATEINVYDSNGRLYHSAKVGTDRETQGVINLDAKQFAAGMYIVQLTDGIHRVFKKVIVR